MRAGSLVIDTSTIEHGATLQIDEQLRARGIRFLDAPVSGMQARAEDATLTIMCGGGPTSSRRPGRCSSAWATRCCTWAAPARGS
ncbi:NAD(P)-binding domain-containing protein [Achromobacter insuavis]